MAVTIATMVEININIYIQGFVQDFSLGGGGILSSRKKQFIYVHNMVES